MRVRVVQTLQHAENAVKHLKSSPLLGVDCEGVALGRFGRLCTVQLMPMTMPNRGAVKKADERPPVYLFDCEAVDFRPSISISSSSSSSTSSSNPTDPKLESLMKDSPLATLLKPLLEGGSDSPLKIMHDCREDSAALRGQFGVELGNVFDTQIAQALIEPTNSHSGFQDALKFFDQQGLPGSLPGKGQQEQGMDSETEESGNGREKNREKENKESSMDALCSEMKKRMSEDDKMWLRRPLSRDLLRYAVHGCYALGELFEKQIGFLEAMKRGDQKGNGVNDIGAVSLHQKLAAEQSWVIEEEEDESYQFSSSLRNAHRQSASSSSTSSPTPVFPADPISHIIKRTTDSYLPYARMNSDLFQKPKEAAKIGTNLYALCAAKTSNAIYFKLNLGRCGVVSTPSALVRFRDVQIGDFVYCTVSGVSLTGDYLFLDKFDAEWSYHEYRQRPLDRQANKKHLETFREREHKHKPDLFCGREGIVDPLLTSRCAEIYEGEDGWC